MKYDVAIIGAGPAGLFAAYELITKNKKNNKKRIYLWENKSLEEFDPEIKKLIAKKWRWLLYQN